MLRTYRLALITDPTYATYFGGPANVTAAKVTLMNRVDQIYEDDISIRLALIAQHDKLNLNTPAQATDPNGPCGAAACYTQAQLSGCSQHARNRIVLGQIIGAATTTSATSRSASRAAASPASASSAATTRRRAAPASRRRSATSTRSTTWRTRWATSSPATTRSTARS